MRNLLVAVPTHSGAVDSIAIETLLSIQRMMLERGGTMRATFPSAAMIPMLRNLIVADFLAGDEDALLMLDADQGLPVDAVRRMIDLDEPFVGCLYPRRRYDWTAVGAEPLAPTALVQRAMSYVGEPARPANGSNTVTVRDGFVEAGSVGGGAMLLRRAVFTRLADAFPDLRGCGFDPIEFGDARFAANWGFFNPLSIDGVPVAEDFSFCRRWREAGGTIWADITAVAGHAGRHVFAGSYADWVAAQRLRH